MNTLESTFIIIAPSFLLVLFVIILFSALEEKQTTYQSKSCGDMHVMEGVYNKLHKEKGQEYAENSKTYLMLLNRIKSCVESQKGFVSQATKTEWELLKS